MHITYEPKGICARKVEFDIEDGVVKNISFLGGCDGNHKGLAALAEGMTPEEAAKDCAASLAVPEIPAVLTSLPSLWKIF